MLRILLFAFLLLQRSIFSDEISYQHLAVFEGEPSANISGTVNALTGDFFLSEEDIFVAGVEPVRIQRCYMSSTVSQNNSGWFYPILSHINYVPVLFEDYERCGSMHVSEKNGTHLIYTSNLFKDEKHGKKKITSKHTKGHLRLHPGIANTGWTNSGRGEISARSSLKNSHIEIPKKEKTATYHLGDGTVRHYRRVNEKLQIPSLFILEAENLPSGNWIVYSYDKHNRLTEIKTTNPAKTKCYAWARFHYLGDNRDFNIETSDGKTYCYRYWLVNKHTPLFVLAKITHAELPEENFHYHEKNDYRGPLLSVRTFPRGRTLHAGYYEHKHNTFYGHQVFLGDLSDRRLNRVKYLAAPVGHDDQLVPIHTFFYLPGEPGKSRGHTCVNDAYGNSTVYHYSTELRLDLIEFQQQGAPHHLEKIVWGAPDTPLSGNLLARTHCNAAGQPLFAKKHHYDERGNVTEELFFGELTGENPCDLKLGGDQLPIRNTAECASKRYTYSGDGRNLLLRMEEENGTVSLFSYIPNTNLLASKFIQSNGKIQQRQFLEYDGDLICIKETIDDGCHESKEDLTAVTERRIKIISPRKSEPFYGLPDTIEERYLENGAEQLLKKTTLHYSAEGKITRKDIFDANNTLCYSLHYKYDAKGRLIEETNALGQTATSTYDENGNLSTYQDFSGRRKIINTYDFSNRLIQKQEITENGQSHTTHRRYDFKDNLICEIDPLGNETHHEYDAFGNPIVTRLPQTLDENGELITPTLHATYDSAGRKIAVTDARGETTRTHYNARGKPLEISYADGTTEKFLYNLDGTLKCAIDKEGTLTDYTYDYQGRETSKKIWSSQHELLSEETYTYNAFHLIAKTDAEGNVTRYEYDKAGRKCAEEFHQERTEYTYDPLSRLHCIRSGNSYSFTEYDQLDRPIEERIESDTQETLFRTLYEYDTYGNKSTIVRFIDGKECPETFHYDGFGRPIEQIDALGHHTYITYNEDHINPFGQRVLQKIHTDPLGIQTIDIHDTFGRVTSTEKRNPFNEKILREDLFYDPNGNLCRQVSTILSPTAPTRTTTTSWEYGALNRLITLIEAYGTPDEKITRYTYHPSGLCHHIHKPDGVILTSLYDPLGRLISQTSSDGTYRHIFTYDHLHRLLTSTDLNTQATTQRTYDPHGHLLTETLANNLTLSNQYDERGRRIALILPDQTSIRYTYDALFLRQVDRYNHQNLLYSHRYTQFDLSGHLLQEEPLHRLGTIQYTLNPLGQITSLLNAFFSQSIAYNSIGNITQMSWKTPQLQNTHTYSYDDLSQLTQETDHTYTYDSHANRLSSNQNTYQINTRNELLSTSQTQYTYDLNGNLISKTPHTLYRYDALDRLIEIQEPHQLLRFTYDSFHRRLSKTLYLKTDNQWQEKEHLFFLYDDQNEIGATDRSGRIVQLRILGSTPRAEIGAAIAIELDNRLYAPIHDTHGNIRCLISLKTRRIAHTYLYSAFQEEPTTPPISNPWRFSSKRTDDETGLIYYGRRYYDPQTGRWITPDPQGLTAGPNLYAFVNNNPLTKVDLYGLEAQDGAERRWYSNLWDKSCGAVKSSVNFIGKMVFNTFYHAVPFPIVREAGMAVGDMLGGVKYEKMHSGVFSVGEREDPKKSYIYTNGMNTSRLDAAGQAMTFSKHLDDAKVIVVYNATHGTALDGFESGANLSGVSTSPVRNLINTIRDETTRMGGIDGGGRIYLFAFSQGGLISNEAISRISSQERKMLHVNTLASASLFRRKDLAYVRHYVSSNDIVPWCDPYHRTKALFRRDNNVIVVKSKTHSLPGTDHNFDSATFDEPLKKICQGIKKI